MNMEQWDVSFYTMNEAPNPYRAAHYAIEELALKSTFVVVNQLTNKAYEVRLGGAIRCAACGADATQPDIDNCYNCAIPGTEVGGEI